MSLRHYTLFLAFFDCGPCSTYFHVFSLIESRLPYCFHALDCSFAGLKQATAGLLQHWASPLALSAAFPFVLPGVGRPALLPQSPEHDQGCEEDEDEEEEGVDLVGGLSEGGVWATSVKRKRVTKMRKHKWRKRRKLQRQSASRNK